MRKAKSLEVRQSEPGLNKEHKMTAIKLPYYLYLSLAFLWLYSGIVPVLFVQQQSLTMLSQLGIGEAWQMPVFLLASILDIIFGLLILTRYRTYAWLWFVQLMVVISYSVIVGLGLPENWLHPFAPLVKNIPIMALLLYLFKTHSFDY